MQPQQIHTVAIIGCGVIGASWTCLFLSRGLKVIIADPAEGAEEAFQRYLRDAWPALQENGALRHPLAESYEFVNDIKTRLPEVDFVQEVALPVARHL
jgi:3-hydroxyacyl-CoA dehydrogenase